MPHEKNTLLSILVCVLALVMAVAASAGEPQTPEPAIAESDHEHDLMRRLSRLLIMGFNGAEADGAEIASLVAFSGRYPIGGYLLLRRNLRNPSQISALTRRLDDASPEAQFVAVDEEGGAVQRLRGIDGVPWTPSARVIARGSPKASFETYVRLAATLETLGVNLNLAPVVDLDINRHNPVIGELGRSYGADPQTVSEYGVAFVRAHDLYGIQTALKHFPGHGSTNADPHSGPVDAVSSWSSRELEPFRRVIEQTQPGFVLTSHIAFSSPEIGQDNPVRATFSTALTKYLRRDLGFRGLVLTDDLTMGAVMRDHTLEDAVSEALLAGHDMVILANLGDDPQARVARLLHAVATRALHDPDMEAAITIASERVRTFKAIRLAAARTRRQLIEFGPRLLAVSQTGSRYARLVSKFSQRE